MPAHCLLLSRRWSDSTRVTPLTNTHTQKHSSSGNTRRRTTSWRPATEAASSCQVIARLPGRSEVSSGRRRLRRHCLSVNTPARFTSPLRATTLACLACLSRSHPPSSHLKLWEKKNMATGGHFDARSGLQEQVWLLIARVASIRR